MALKLTENVKLIGILIDQRIQAIDFDIFEIDGLIERGFSCFYRRLWLYSVFRVHK